MEAFDKDPDPAGVTVQFAALLAVKVSWSAGNRMVDTGSGVTVNAVAGASMAMTLPLARMYSRVFWAQMGRPMLRVRMAVIEAFFCIFFFLPCI